MITYRPDFFYIAHWFVDQPSAAYQKETGAPNMNWIACLWQNPDGTLELRYRFAYYDKHEKHVKSSWYGGTAAAHLTPEQAKVPLDKLAQMTSIRNGGSKWERVDLNVYGDEAIEILMQKPWMRIVAKGHEMN